MGAVNLETITVQAVREKLAEIARFLPPGNEEFDRYEALIRRDLNQLFDSEGTLIQWTKPELFYTYEVLENYTPPQVSANDRCGYETTRLVVFRYLLPLDKIAKAIEVLPEYTPSPTLLICPETTEDPLILG